MPPKAGGRRRKGRQKTSDGSEEVQPLVTRDQVESMQREVDDATERLRLLRQEAVGLREMEEQLKEELVTLQEDSRCYVSAAQERLERRRGQVEETCRQLEEEAKLVEEEGRREVEAREERRRQLQREKLEYEARLERAKILLIDMEPYSKMKQQQADEIERLTDELEQLRTSQDAELNKLKAEFVRERRRLEQNYKTQILQTKAMVKQSIGPAIESHMARIRASNERLQLRVHELTRRQTRLNADRKLAKRRYVELRGFNDMWTKRERGPGRCEPTTATSECLGEGEGVEPTPGHLEEGLRKVNTLPDFTYSWGTLSQIKKET